MNAVARWIASKGTERRFVTEAAFTGGALAIALLVCTGLPAFTPWGPRIMAALFCVLGFAMYADWHLTSVKTSLNWIAGIAHASWACLFVGLFASFGHGLIGAALFVPAAALKEYWFDVAYETPKQTYLDSTLDFAGYMVGIGLALLVVHPILTFNPH